MHAKTPYKWLRGDRPRSPWPALTAALLTGELGRSISTAELGWGGDDIEAVSAISGLVLPWTAAGSLHAVRAVTDAGSMQRRILLTLLGAAACAPAHEWLIARPDAGVARSSGLPVPAGVVDGLDDITGRLRRMDDQLGSGTLLHWLDEAQAHSMAGFCYLRLADWVQARKHLHTALRLRDLNYRREGAQSQIMLAHIYLRQDRPEVDHAVSLVSRAVETLTGEVDSARCVGHLARLVGDLAPYRRRPAVRQLTEQAAGLLTSH